MDAEILKAAGKVAGIGGIAIAAFVLILQSLLKTNTFARLDRDRTYRLLRGIVISAVVIALAGIAAYVYATTAGKPKVIVYRGSVRDATTKLPLQDAEVSFLGRPEIAAQKTGASGNFSFTLESASGTFQGKAQITRDGYDPWEKTLEISAATTEEVLLRAESPREYELSGEVRDENGAVAGVEISAEGKEATAISDAKGHFRLKVKGARGDSFTLGADKKGYSKWRKNNVEAGAGIVILLGKEPR